MSLRWNDRDANLSCPTEKAILDKLFLHSRFHLGYLVYWCHDRKYETNIITDIQEFTDTFKFGVADNAFCGNLWKGQ